MGGLPLGCGNALESRYGASRYGGEEGFQAVDILQGVEVEESLGAIAEVGDGGTVTGLPGLQAALAGGQVGKQVREQGPG